MIKRYEQERVGDYIKVNSGLNFYPLAPRMQDITVQDVAHSLSNLCRFTGHGDRFYSVGEHSILCAKLASGLGFSERVQLLALMHDASESIVNDLARPVKQNIPQYKMIEDNIMSVMWQVAGVDEPSESEYEIIKKLDNTLLLNEMSQIMSRNIVDYPQVDNYGIHVDLSEGYNASESKNDFLDMFYKLSLSIE